MRNRNFGLLAVFGLLLAGCSQEEVIDVSRTTNPIKFSAGFASRGTEITITNLNGFVVTAYNNGTTGHKAVNGVYPDPYFKDEPFIGNNTQFSSLTGKDWPKNEDPVEFFAYYPQLSVLRKNFATYDYLTGVNAKDSTLIELYNMCGTDGKVDPIDLNDTVKSIFKFDPAKLLPGLKLGRFYVPRDISQHVDFITAHKMGTKKENEMSGLTLNFHHQLAQVELRGFNNSNFYTVDVAGVYLSYPMVAGAMFNFCDETGNLQDVTGGHWEFAIDPMYSAVEYIYQPANPEAKQAADNILRLQHNGTTGVAEDTPLGFSRDNSLMGNGGNAMVLPTVRDKWAHIDDATNKSKNMYIGVLMNVNTVETTEVPAIQLFPPLNATKLEGLRIVSFVVDKESQAILKRVYKDRSVNRYYDNPGFTGNPVELKTEDVPDPETNVVTTVVTEEFRDFAWGAVPVAVDWQLGNKYIYTLDFSSGVGVRTPLDSEPGTPILGGNIQLYVGVTGWNQHTPEAQVPSE